MRINKSVYHLMAFFCVTVWGITFISTKVLLQYDLSPAEIMFHRFLMAYILIWFISYKKLWTGNIKDELYMLLMGFTGGTLYFVTENMALEYTLASNVSVLLCMAPIFTAILTKIFIKNTGFSRKFIVGSLLALLGVIFVVFNGRILLKIKPIGDILTLMSAFSWAIYTIVLNKFDKKYDILFMTRKIFFYGLLTLLPVFYFTPLQFDLNVLTQPIVLGNFLFLGVVASFGCFILWNRAVKELGGISASNYIYLSPIVTLIASSIILNETITWMAITGAILIIGGVYLAEKKSSLK